LQQLKLTQTAEIAHTRSLNELEIAKSKELAGIEAKKFKDIVDAIGANTIKSMAEAGPAMQAKLLGGLGLKSFLITDGNSPINLFNTASGLVGGNLQEQ
jgi:major vault protein